ncbi:MAG TPA: hypothetical protein VJ719_06405 [Chthoniobacterales bacterium]|nr:hypothetical protein [Chthoniobacterales bacterium]
MQNIRAFVGFILVIGGAFCGLGAVGKGRPDGLTSPQNGARRGAIGSQLATGVGGTWSVVASPNGSADATLNQIACASPVDCWAIGGYQAGSSRPAMFEHWDGSAWSIVDIADAAQIQLNAITCVSASDCWAVGHRGFELTTVTMHWNGNLWQTVSSPNANGRNSLRDVACSSATDCWAVGFYVTDAFRTLIEHWNGSSWTIVSSPNPSVSERTELDGVTCLSASNCWAVGYYVVAETGPAKTLVEHWDGTVWSVVASGNTNGRNNYLNSVTCSSASNCLAVGYQSFYSNQNFDYVYLPLIARWNGNTWSVIASPSVAAPAYLNDVSCASATDCWAVGTSQANGTNKSIIEHWNGTSWSLDTSPNTNATQQNYLSGVVCNPASDCWAVGYQSLDYQSGGTNRTLIQRWQGMSWFTVASANPSSISTSLNDVGCASATDCWGVGTYYDGSSSRVMIQHWNGSSWAVAKSPDIQIELQAVTCISGVDCWAVGSNYDSAGKTLIEHWDGNAWSIVSAPSPGTELGGINHLLDVACVSASNCWAVGYYWGYPGGYQSLIEHWNGSAWSAVTAANPGSLENYLYAVTCNSAVNCWAVGEYSNGGSDHRTLIQRWDGASWRSVTSPNTGPMDGNHLYDVTCNSTSDCWAVGRAVIGGSGRTLILRWNGISWSLVTSPNASSSDNYLNSVKCASASDCWAVGSTLINNIYQTLVEHWDGISWTIVPAPNISNAQFNAFLGLTCGSALDCWAVGYYTETGGASRTMVQHFSASPRLLKITSMARNAEHLLQLNGQAEPLQLIEFEASSDLLIDFEPVGSTVSDESGAFQFEDDNTPPSKFYRALYP